MKLSAPMFRLKRTARSLSKKDKIPLHLALDQIAVGEGFKNWNHLCKTYDCEGPVERLLDALVPGDLVVIAARPGQGKTIFGVRLLVQAAKSGKHAALFSAEMSEREATHRLADNNAHGLLEQGDILLDLNDALCARRIQEVLGEVRRGTIVVVDYLQLLDQSRSAPPLAEQIRVLKAYAEEYGIVLAFLSQVHRSFDPGTKPVPDFSDIRLPNPVDLSLFSKGCFMQDDRVNFAQTKRLGAAAPSLLGVSKQSLVSA